MLFPGSPDVKCFDAEGVLALRQLKGIRAYFVYELVYL
ncbi:hypothetical protein IMPR6_10218 [Imperialibacter sp. EC-SDR9]|nr:hypothetical protein IMPERIA75_10217 [Imperialibacter sp. 75]CAD5248092.1 hypothetical protein IMPERIA89_10218 [Imperialibacter sp. 89]VVS97352.1 hypothetical protein IMPR6_10218 [Imperialibacter sp. EC-SDR9]